MKASIKKLLKGEKGQVLPIVMMLLLGGVLIITPALALASTSIKTSKLHKDNLLQYYAADAGMEEAVAAIKKVYPGTIDESNYPQYLSLNSNDVTFTIENPGFPKIYLVTSTAVDPISNRETTIQSYVRGGINILDYAATSRNEIIEKPGSVIDGDTYPNYDTPWPTDLDLTGFYELITPYPRTVQMLPEDDDSNTGGFTATPSTANLWNKVDETTLDDTDYITGRTDGGGQATFGIKFDYPPDWDGWPSDTYISSVSVTYWVRSVGQQQNKIGACIKVGNTISDYYNGALENPPKSNESIMPFTTEWKVNPKTTDQWTLKEVIGTDTDHPENCLTAFGVWSNDFNPDVNVYMVHAQVNYTTMEPGIESSPFTFDDDTTIYPSFISGALDIYCTSGSNPTLTISGDPDSYNNGAIYLTGKLNIGTTGQDFILDLNQQAIFTENTSVGNGIGQCAINIGGKCTLTGSGVIVAIGDIYFQPKLQSKEGDFIFVMSLEGRVHFAPTGQFYGSIAGNLDDELWPGNILTWNPYSLYWDIPFPIYLFDCPGVRLKYVNWTITRN